MKNAQKASISILTDLSCVTHSQKFSVGTSTEWSLWHPQKFFPGILTEMFYVTYSQKLSVDTLTEVFCVTYSQRFSVVNINRSVLCDIFSEVFCGKHSHQKTKGLIFSNSGKKRFVRPIRVSKEDRMIKMFTLLTEDVKQIIILWLCAL
jgi:hypothetical protein